VIVGEDEEESLFPYFGASRMLLINVSESADDSSSTWNLMVSFPAGDAKRSAVVVDLSSNSRILKVESNATSKKFGPVGIAMP
jgi:hypothetical protein